MHAFSVPALTDRTSRVSARIPGAKPIDPESARESLYRRSPVRRGRCHERLLQARPAQLRERGAPRQSEAEIEIGQQVRDHFTDTLLAVDGEAEAIGPAQQHTLSPDAPWP